MQILLWLASTNLIKTRGILRKHTRWRVGRGDNIQVWKDIWLPNKNNPRVDSFPYPLMEEATVNSLFDESANWDEIIIRTIFSPRNAELILKIPLSRQQIADKLI